MTSDFPSFPGCEDKDIDDAYDVLIDAATEEHKKGDDQELFFFFAADVSPYNWCQLL